MGSAEEWRARATHLRREADKASGPQKSELLKLATDWDMLAERLTRMEQRDRDLGIEPGAGTPLLR